MTSNAVSVSGNTIVSDSISPVIVVPQPGGASIKPPSQLPTGKSFPYQGTFYACLPSVPNSSANVHTIQVSHAFHLAKAVSIELYHGANNIFDSTTSNVNLVTVDVGDPGD